MQESLYEVESTFEKKLNATRKECEEYQRLLAAARTESAQLLADLKSDQAASLAEEKDRSLRLQRELQLKYERDLADREAKFEQQVCLSLCRLILSDRAIEESSGGVTAGSDQVDKQQSSSRG